MKEQLTLLYKLQQADSQREADEQALAGLDDGMELQEMLAQEETVLEQRQAALADTRAKLHDKQLELQGTEDEHKSKWNRAYGGVVSDPRELAALGQKLEQLAQFKDHLEDEIIGLLDEEESRQQAADEQESAVEELRSKLAEVREYHKTRSAELSAEMVRLRQERTEITGPIPAPLLEVYESIRQKRDNVAVSAVEQGTCTACHTAVSSNYVTLLRNSTGVLRCENCGRILIIVQKEG